jgi:signal transduction histidine kinase
MSIRSLRVQLAVMAFLAIYLPVLLVRGVTVVAETENTVTLEDQQVTRETSTSRSPWVTGTVVVLAPVAAALAWWLSGQALRPIERVRAVAEEIKASDLSRRIGMTRGQIEVVALAASFDAMLDRLELAAESQRLLVEEASHELRTPLAVLSTNAEVLLTHPEPTLDLYRDGIVRSQQAAGRLADTVDDLLVDARGRARALVRRPADLVAVAAAAVEDARVLAAAAGVTVAVAGPAGVEVPVEEATMRRAIGNLVANAVRHAPAGSTVDVAVVPGDGEVAVTVTDHGPGLSADEQGRAFERFWRGRADGGGTGLGLPIARHIARAHGGDVTVTSPGPAGDGAVFTLTVRRAP